MVILPKLSDMKRCLSIDWLEVFCLEPVTCDSDYYRSLGFAVEERDYGTRIYKEMFTCLDRDLRPFIEVRRVPLSSVLPEGACHLRLVNRYCYAADPCGLMLHFIEIARLVYVRLSRFDICLDFKKFDSGDNPQSFVHRYMSGRFSKVNVSQLRSYGEDQWGGRVWSSLSWGKKSSPVSTKLYDKTLELAQVHNKPYIKRRWFDCSLVDDPVTGCSVVDGKLICAHVWRLEFSISSAVKNWLTISKGDSYNKKYQSFRHDLQWYREDGNLLRVFSSLVTHYFHFKHYESGKSKYDCKDKVLFYFKDVDVILKPDVSAVLPEQADELNHDSRLARELQLLAASSLDSQLKRSCDYVVEYLHNSQISAMCKKDSREVLLSLQRVMSERVLSKDGDPTQLINAFASFCRSVLKEDCVPF